jgi:hypothetical protein
MHGIFLEEIHTSVSLWEERDLGWKGNFSLYMSSAYLNFCKCR